jgi:hypothetical protein
VDDITPATRRMTYASTDEAAGYAPSSTPAASGACAAGCAGRWGGNGERDELAASGNRIPYRMVALGACRPISRRGAIRRVVDLGDAGGG